MISSKCFKQKSSFIMVAAILVVTFTCMAVFTTGCDKKEKNAKKDVTSTGAFFIADNSKYALFNENGKKLTDFIFTSIDDFINGTTIVKKGEQYGIINDKGKMVVDFNTYKFIESVGGMYRVTTDDYKEYLVDNTGKILYDLDKYYFNKYIGIDTFSILQDKESEKYIIINYKGKEITSFDAKDDSKEPVVSGKDKFGVVYYDSNNYVFDTDSNSVINTFSDDSGYCINEILNDGSIVLNTCSTWYESKVKNAYKVIKKSGVFDIDSSCESITLQDNLLYCKIKGDNYNLDSNYKKLYNSEEVAFDSKLNYVQNHSASAKDSVDFYNSNNNVVKNIKCRKLGKTGYSKNGMFVLATYYSTECGTNDGKYEYYDASGKKLFDKDFEEAGLFDDNGLAIVKEDTINYYLMNEKGKQLTDKYTKISKSGDYYIVTNHDQKIGVVDKTGKLVIPCQYQRVDIDVKNGKVYVQYSEDEKSYTLYSLSDKKVVFVSDSYRLLYTNDEGYISHTEGNKIEYYLFKTGKKFYEIEK